MAKVKQTQDAVTQSDVMGYVVGFISALVLTFLAYVMVVNHWLHGWSLILGILLLAVVQLVVQLVYFLHLGKGKGKRWNLAAFFFMLMVLFILVGGSLWIMANLNYNMQMTPKQMDEYMQKQNNKGF